MKIENLVIVASEGREEACMQMRNESARQDTRTSRYYEEASADNECLPGAHLNCQTGAPSANTVYHTHAAAHGRVGPFEHFFAITTTHSSPKSRSPSRWSPNHAKHRRRPLGQDLRSTYALVRPRYVAHVFDIYGSSFERHYTCYRRMTDITTRRMSLLREEAQVRIHMYVCMYDAWSASFN